MATLPVARLTMPSDLRGIENGKLPVALLKPIKPSGRMHRNAAVAWSGLMFLAQKEGIQLAHVGDYRPYEQQVQLFKARMKPFPDAKRQKQVTRKWNGETWYLHTGAPVATPGTSNHGWGLAIDAAQKDKRGQTTTITAKVAGAKRTGLAFLLENAPALGFSWELQDEPWHIRYVAGDKMPPALLAVVEAM